MPKPAWLPYCRQRNALPSRKRCFVMFLPRRNLQRGTATFHDGPFNTKYPRASVKPTLPTGSIAGRHFDRQAKCATSSWHCGRLHAVDTPVLFLSEWQRGRHGPSSAANHEVMRSFVIGACVLRYGTDSCRRSLAPPRMRRQALTNSGAARIYVTSIIVRHGGPPMARMAGRNTNAGHSFVDHHDYI